MSDPIPPQDANIIPKPLITELSEKMTPLDPLNESVNMARQVFAEATRYFESRGSMPIYPILLILII